MLVEIDRSTLHYQARRADDQPIRQAMDKFDNKFWLIVEFESLEETFDELVERLEGIKDQVARSKMTIEPSARPILMMA